MRLRVLAMCLFFLAAIAVALPGRVNSATWDAAADWVHPTPGTVWNYGVNGWFDEIFPMAASDSPDPVSQYYRWAAQPIFYVRKVLDDYYEVGSYQPTGTVVLGNPGGTYWGTSWVCGKSYVSWTSPVTALVKVNAEFTGRNHTPVTKTDVAIQQGPGTFTTVYSGGIRGYAGTLSDAPVGRHTTRCSKLFAVVPSTQFNFRAGAAKDVGASTITGISAQVESLPGKGGIAGVVTINTPSKWAGSPVVGATVTVMSGGTTIATATTGPNGYYSLVLNPGSSYAVSVSKMGYSVATFGATVVADQLVTQNVALDGSAGAFPWDAAYDFSGSSNPNFEWSYGRANNGSGFALLSAATTDPDVAQWSNSATGTSIRHTTTGNEMVIDSIWLRPDQAVLLPGATQDAVVRFTAPVTGPYTIGASFEKLGSTVSSSGVAVYDGTKSKVNWSGSVSQGAPASTSSTVSLTAGDKIWFVATAGGDEVGMQASVKLNIGSGSLITGTVKADSTTYTPGKPIVDAKVELVGESKSTMTGVDGSYVLLASSGSHTLKASKPGFAAKQVGVSAASGQKLTQDFDLAFASAVVNIAKLGDLVNVPDNTPVKITTPVNVTIGSGAFADGSYYVEDADRSCGVQVFGGSMVTGEWVPSLEGLLTTLPSGERALTYVKEGYATRNVVFEAVDGDNNPAGFAWLTFSPPFQPGIEGSKFTGWTGDPDWIHVFESGSDPWGRVCPDPDYYDTLSSVNREAALGVIRSQPTPIRKGTVRFYACGWSGPPGAERKLNQYFLKDASTNEILKTMDAPQSTAFTMREWNVDDLLLGPAPVQPLGVACKALGGGASGYQPGITDAAGTNNIGLLVKTWGKVSSPSEADRTFTLDDGSGVGLKVVQRAGYKLPPDGKLACVTGISSCETNESGTSRLLKSVGKVQLPNYIAFDTFTDRDIFGTTEDPDHYPWIPNTHAFVGGGFLNVTNVPISEWGIASIDGYKPDDFTLKTRLRINNPTVDNQSLIVMRAAAPNTVSGYFLAILPAWSLKNNLPSYLLMAFTSPTNGWAVVYDTLPNYQSIDWSAFHDVEITAAGNSWSAKFDGVTLFENVPDINPAKILDGGYIGLGDIGASVDFDSVEIIGH